eukprot:TRINITY_DN4583_c0_g1_i1.p1 TRINITY_DN4583_c0_g1~~TRINITY_DN4583_c0_g1_i1.p1  ORF type:complete len:278 (+),score=51.43 TRINITY_DN4583_c0_g1_i1:162-995(+)
MALSVVASCRRHTLAEVVVLLLLLVVVSGCVLLVEASYAPYVKVDCKTSSHLEVEVRGFNYTVANQTVLVHVARLPYCNHFHVLPSLGGCPNHVNVSVTAAANGCYFATNGNFFGSGNKSCEGSIISDGREIQINEQFDANFGITKNNELVIGTLTLKEIRDLKFQQLISNKPVMIREGKNLQRPGGEIAPRTAIGFNSRHDIVLIQVDGAEVQYVGLTLGQLGDLMVKEGITEGINLDGGGSSVTWYKDRVVSYPTCTDTLMRICERPVTVVMCMK